MNPVGDHMTVHDQVGSPVMSARGEDRENALFVVLRDEHFLCGAHPELTRSVHDHDIARSDKMTVVTEDQFRLALVESRVFRGHELGVADCRYGCNIFLSPVRNLPNFRSLGDLSCEVEVHDPSVRWDRFSAPAEFDQLCGASHGNLTHASTRSA